MTLRVPAVLVVLALGAIAALIGDHGHVVTGTTEYFTHAVPFIWSSPVWFPVMGGSRRCHWPNCGCICPARGPT